MGFEASHFAGAVTSGEVTHEHLSTRPTPFWQQLGNRCLHFTWGARGNVPVDDYNVTVRSLHLAYQDPSSWSHMSAAQNHRSCQVSINRRRRQWPARAAGGPGSRRGRFCSRPRHGSAWRRRLPGTLAVQFSGNGVAFRTMCQADRSPCASDCCQPRLCHGRRARAAGHARQPRPLL